MYGMTKYGKLFAVELTYWLINEARFKKYQYKMSIFYKYAPDGKETVLLLVYENQNLIP